MSRSVLPCIPRERHSASDLHVTDTAVSIRQLFRELPVPEQQRLLAELIKSTQLIAGSRAGPVLGTVVRLLPRRAEWTAQEIKQEVADSGVAATSREVFNAIGYLIRKGHVQRVGTGKYLVAGVGLQSMDDFGGEPSGCEY